jgi:hypothetical protein
MSQKYVRAKHVVTNKHNTYNIQRIFKSQSVKLVNLSGLSDVHLRKEETEISRPLQFPLHTRTFLISLT